MTKHFLQRANTCLLIPDREPMTDPSMDTTRLQLVEAIICIRVTYRNIYGSRKDSKTAVSPEPKAGVTVHKTWSTLHSQQAARLVGECLSQVPQLVCKPLVGSSTGFCFFRKLVCSRSPLCSLALLGGRRVLSSCGLLWQGRA